MQSSALAPGRGWGLTQLLCRHRDSAWPEPLQAVCNHEAGSLRELLRGGALKIKQFSALLLLQKASRLRQRQVWVRDLGLRC